MASQKIMTTFNTQLLQFLGEMKNLFPENDNIAKAVDYADLIRKSNPRMTILCWQMYVCKPYSDIIESENIAFFLEKDYATDLALANINEDTKNMILTMIESGMREPMRQLDAHNQQMCMKHLSVLCRLANAYK